MRYTNEQLVAMNHVPKYMFIPDKASIYVPSKIIAETSKEFTCVTYKNERRSINKKKYKLQHPKLMFNAISDLAALCQAPENLIYGDMNAAMMLHSIHTRFEHARWYSWMGPILLCVNPFQWTTGLYTKDVIQFYVDQRVQKKSRDVPPHVFAVAERAFMALANKDSSGKTSDLSIVVSGESGAGKTEAAKQNLMYLAAVSMASKKSGGGGGGQEEKSSGSSGSSGSTGQRKALRSTRSMLAMGYSPGVSTGVVDKIISANPILEAFGNAKTTRNNNSSRFGKWLQVVYDGGLSILGSKNKTFLLEKSRVVFQSVGEHNFHIFYFLLFGAPQELKIKLQLNSATFSVWKYVQWSSSSRPTDKETLAPLITHFNEMKLSFESLNFKPNEINALFQIIAGILHLGNCEYIAMDAGHVEGSQLSRETKHWMTTAAELLEVDGEELEMWTTRDETSVRAQHFLGGKVVELSMYLTLWCLILVVSFFFVKVQKSSGASFTLKHLNVLDANSARDSSSKAIYSKLFDWLVTRINDECLPKEAAEKQVNFIGLLDIFGFERFDSNGFDQLCKVSSYWSFDFRVEC